MRPLLADLSHEWRAAKRAPTFRFLPRLAWTLCLIALWSGSRPAGAQAIPRLKSLSPEWVRQGSVVDLLLEGDNLGTAKAFVFSGETGLVATVAPVEKPPANLLSSGGGITTVSGNEEKQLHITLVVPSGSSLGRRELRVITPEGVSNPLGISVTDLSEREEQGDNNTLEKAQEIELPAGISGKIGANGQTDYFRFEAKKGDRLIFDVEAARLGSPLDSSLALLNAEGKELARSEDAHNFDSFIDFTVPDDGQYILQLRDFRFRGGADYSYHMAAGPLPYLDAIFPFGGQRGQQVELNLRGRNLGDLTRMRLKIDGRAPLGRQDIRAVTARGITNPRPFDVADFQEFMVPATNSATPVTNTVSVPVTINGSIEKEKETDAFKFKAAKGQRLVFEVFAGRFGSALDALLVLADSAGKVLQQNDDAAGADAQIDQTFADEGEYVLAIRDLLERGGTNFGYRLSIRPPSEPDFSFRFFPDAPRLNRGCYSPVRVELTRQAGFGGPVEVTCEDLPPGITAAPLLIPPDLTAGTLLLNASEGAALGSFPLRLSGASAVRGRKITRTGQPLLNDRPVQQAFLTLLEMPPFTVEVLPAFAQVEQNQSTTLDVAVQRRSGFAEEITLSVEGFSSGREPASRNLEVTPVVLKALDTRGTLTLKAKLDSELGTRPIMVKAESKVAGQPSVQYSRAIPLSVTEFPFLLSTPLTRLSLTVVPPGSKSAAGEADFPVKVSRRGWFTEDIDIALEGLPEGITATTTNLPRNIPEVVFKLTATEKAAPGKTNTFQVVASANVNGRKYQQRPGAITLVVAAPAEAAAGTETK